MKALNLFVIAVATTCLFLLSFFFYVTTISRGNLYADRPYAEYDPLSECVTPHGTLLGVADGVPAFSNCNVRFKTRHVAYITMHDRMDVSDPMDFSKSDKIMTTNRYMALDYIMRWMFFNRGVIPHLQEDIDSMWATNYFYNPVKSTQDWDAEYINNFKVATSLDDRRYIAPRVADVILYTRNEQKGLIHGHAAVIVKVEDDTHGAGGPEKLKEMKSNRLHPRLVYVAEQNFHNQDWGGKNFSRVLQFKWRKTASNQIEGYLIDPDELMIVGRMRIGKMRPPREEGNVYREELEKNDDDDL